MHLAACCGCRRARPRSPKDVQVAGAVDGNSSTGCSTVTSEGPEEFPRGMLLSSALSSATSLKGRSTSMNPAVTSGVEASGCVLLLSSFYIFLFFSSSLSFLSFLFVLLFMLLLLRRDTDCTRRRSFFCSAG